jgi:hypothetical protein
MLILKKQRNATDSPVNGLALYSEWDDGRHATPPALNARRLNEAVVDIAAGRLFERDDLR